MRGAGEREVASLRQSLEGLRPPPSPPAGPQGQCWLCPAANETLCPFEHIMSAL